MKTTTNTGAAAKMIENLIAERYNVNALNCDAIVVEWAAGIIEETHGSTVAAKEWRRVNARRYKLGVYTSIPQYGTPMFAAF